MSVFPFDEVLRDASRGVRKVPQREYLTEGSHPIVDQGKSLVAGFCDSEEGLCNTIPAIVFGDHTRCVKFIDEPFAAGADGVKILVPARDGDNPRYLYHALRSARIPSLGYSRHYKLVKELSFVVPERKQQDRIVQLLDAVEKRRTVAEEQLNIFDELIKSRFAEVFAKGYPSAPLLSCVHSIDSGRSPKCNSYSRNGTMPAVLKLSAISSGTYLEAENKSLLDGEEIVVGKEVAKGDILLARKNTPELVGKSAYVNYTDGNVMFPDIVFRMHPLPTINGIYLSHLLAGPLFDSIRSLAHGSAKSMSNIPKTELSRLEIPLPPLDLQEEFAAFVRQVDKLKFECQQAIDKLQVLYDSLAQDYFRN